ncbi:MAG: hypothetical protein CVU03_00760 [Bacteroidetes bacterium HGW-Bacteroidetes-2]|nr:MAG: hypothetical protein CVU03_00760 [Bacteroidetes bacterium HGW-Bacteroidetes-2]
MRLCSKVFEKYNVEPLYLYKLFIHKMQKLVILTVFLFFFYSCKDKEQVEKIIDEQENVELPSTSLQIPVLSPEARNAIASWQRFQEFENDLKRINQGGIRRFSRETERMAAAADSLQITIPEVLNSNAISSRMRVVNTRVKLLHEALHQNGSDSLRVWNNLRETNMAYANLLLQINEKFEKQRIDAMAKTDENIETNKKKQEYDSL